MSGKSTKATPGTPRVSTRQQIKRWAGKAFGLANRYSILKEQMLSVRVQAGSYTHTHSITSQPTLTLGLGISHTVLAAPNQTLKLEVLRQSAASPNEILSSCGAALDHLLQTPGLGDTKLVPVPVQDVKGDLPVHRSREPVRGLKRAIESQAQRGHGAGARTFALVIGIDKYQSPRKPQLQGAVNDARAMVHLLETTFGVPNANICALYDQDATRKRILAEFKSLITNPNILHGDAVIIYFAGHGSQARAPDGWHSEGGMVETLCPVDEEFGEGESEIHGIPDRTIARLITELSKAKGKNISLIFDCCHSGGLARGEASAGLFRYAPTIAPLPVHLDEDIPPSEVPSDSRKFTTSLSNYVLLAACRPNERAKEAISADGKHCGAFSDSLFRRMKKCGPATTYAELLRFVVRDLENHSQHPICEGENKDHPLFDGTIMKQNSKLFAICDDEDGCYRVDGGALHGIVPGTLFSIRQVDPHTRSVLEVGVFEAQTVYTASTIISVFGKGSVVIPPNSKAAILKWGSSGHLLDVLPDGIDPSWITSDHYPRYHMTTSRSASTLVVRSTDSDHFSFQRGLPYSKFSEKLLEPPISFTPIALQHTLNHMNDFHLHLVRSNPFVPTSLKGNFGLRLHRMEGEKIGLDLFSNNCAVVTPGAKFTFTLTNESNLDLFPYLFFFDPNECSIQRWYCPPAINMEAPLAHGTHGNPSLFRVGSEGTTPSSFSFSIPDEVDTTVAFIKLFVTSCETDLDNLEQGSLFTPTAANKSPRRLSCRGGRPSRSRKQVDDAWDASCYTVTICRDGVADR